MYPALGTRAMRMNKGHGTLQTLPVGGSRVSITHSDGERGAVTGCTIGHVNRVLITYEETGAER